VRNLMKSAYGLTLMAAAGLLAMSPAHATIVDNGTYTTDTITGLDWLDLTATAGQSYNSVIGSPPPGGWAYATLSQVSSLFDDAGGVGPYNFSGGNGLAVVEGPATSLLRSLMGDLGPFGLPGAGGITADVDTSPGGPGPFPHFLAFYLDFPPTTNYLLAPFGSEADDSSTASVGSFLIRETAAVPEPGSLVLLGSALAMAGLRRRRGKTAPERGA
jgi:hypothetical protein